MYGNEDDGTGGDWWILFNPAPRAKPKVQRLHVPPLPRCLANDLTRPTLARPWQNELTFSSLKQIFKLLILALRSRNTGSMKLKLNGK